MLPALLPLHDFDGCCCLCCSGKEGNYGVKVLTEGKFEIGDANVGPRHWLQLLCFSCSNNRETGEKGRGTRGRWYQLCIMRLRAPTDTMLQRHLHVPV